MVHSLYLLSVNVIQVILYELDTGREVGLIELIWNIPTKRAKLAPFLTVGIKQLRMTEYDR